MPKKARTKVPYRVTFNTRPEISVDLGGRPLRVTVRGVENKVIAHVVFAGRNIEVLGSDESEPMKLPYKYLKQKGVDGLRGWIKDTVKG